jgi:DNA-binding HxlR family transcriptional regulator
VLKATLLVISSSELEGVVTVSQLPSQPVHVEYVVTPKK